jgi:hypothetical protein
MAICPHCHVMDKNFFAPKCHACNTPVGFFEQVFASLLFNTVVLGGFVFILWLVFG